MLGSEDREIAKEKFYAAKMPIKIPILMLVL